MGKVVGIAAHNEEKGPVVVYASAKVSFEQGVADSIKGKDEFRAVAIITEENWSAVCQELGQKLHWTTRRANLMVEGIDLENTTGKILRIGEFFLEIISELKPGNRMDEEFVGLKDALTPNWRGGIVCRILKEGVVKEGDLVSFYEKPKET